MQQLQIKKESEQLESFIIISIKITNSSGDIYENTFYLPYGSIESGGEGRFDYEAKETDGTDLQYFGARYYDSYMRMFTQADSVIPDVYDPQQLNAYAFERNNPYRYVDESGLWAVQVGGTGALGISPLFSTAGIGLAFSYSAEEEFDIGLYASTTPLGLIDSGVNYTHPDLGGCLGSGCKVIAGYDYGNDDSDPMDYHGHGTHVVGIIASENIIN